ncbi:MAG: hypothetical protein QGI11_03720, partial [Nitrospinota bacterium]|nr:hypothetical protein [Nitrospinota bacterium]
GNQVTERRSGKAGRSQNLREALPEVKIIFASAYSEDDSRARGLLRSGDVYITKPFELNELLAKIQEVLKTRGG